MFDLEQAISDWRRRMLAAGITSPIPLEELEIHLRDDVERQMQSGSDVSQAFEAAVAQIGQAKVLHNEFKRAKGISMKRIAIISLGIFCVLFGPAVFLPALAKYQKEEVWNGAVIVPMVLGALITLAGLATTYSGFKRRKA